MNMHIFMNTFGKWSNPRLVLFVIGPTVWYYCATICAIQISASK